MKTLILSILFSGFFTTENELSKVFQKVADTLSSEFRFAHTFEKEVLEKYDYKE